MSFKAASRETTDRRDPMQEFADRIVAELENGVKPWVRRGTLRKRRSAGPLQSRHRQALSRHQRAHSRHGYARLSERRSALDDLSAGATKSWQVRKGEKSTTIFFTKPYEVEDDNADDGKKTVRVLKHYAVFHASQIDGVPSYKAPGVEEAPWTRPEAADIILKEQRSRDPYWRRQSLLLTRDRPHSASARTRVPWTAGIRGDGVA